MSKKQPKKTYILPAGVAAYPHIVKPDSEGKFADDKYKVTVVYDADVDLGVIRAAVEAEARAVLGEKFDAENFQFPFRERGEDDPKEAFRGKVTVTTKSQFKPEVVDAKKQPVSDKIASKMYGDLIKVMVTVYVYEKTEKVKEKGKLVDVLTQGASLQLVAVQIIEKRAGAGGYANGFGEEDGGYEASADESEAPGGEDDGDF